MNVHLIKSHKDQQSPDNRSLERQIENAKVLREQVIAVSGDDPDFIRDTIEGETSLFEMIDLLVASDGEDEALIESMEAYADRVKSRIERVKKRRDVRKSLIALALELAETQRRETPSGTIAVKKLPRAAIVTEESEIPSKFWKPQPPKLDKRALADALKAGETIPGATLSNGGTTIQINRK